MKRIIEELEKVRLGLGFTQGEMGDLLSIRRETYNLWKQGNQYPDSTGLVKIYSLFRTVEEDRSDLEIWDEDENWSVDKWIDIVKEDVEEITVEKIENIKDEQLTAQGEK